MKFNGINWLLYTMIGVLVVFSAFFFINFYLNKNKIKEENIRHKIISNSDTLLNGKCKIQIHEETEFEIEDENKILNEKIVSLHYRIGDLYYSLGIIITLMILGLVTVSWRTRSEVNNYMDEHFEQYKQKILDNHAESSRILGEIRVQKDLIVNMVSNSGNSDSNPKE